jgi:5,5'-dehydrodivanillate O-demethylase
VDYADYSHTGPGTLGGRYLRTFWHPVFRAQDLAAGRAVPLRVMGEDFTLYRGADGAPHVLAARCAHRATQLSTGWVEGDCLRCFYHGWKYDPTGQCVEQPAEEASFARKVRIASYPAQEYLGLIFAYLGAGEIPALPRYPFMEAFDATRQVRLVRSKRFPYNYRNGLENSVDPVHVAFVHRNSEYRGLVGCPSVTAEETAYGMVLHAARPGAGVRVTQFQMPTALYIKQGPRYPGEAEWRDCLLWRVPVEDDSFDEIAVIHAHLSGEAAEGFLEHEERLMRENPAAVLGEAVLAGQRHVDEIEDLTLAVTTQDYVAQKGQGVIYDRASERLGRSDAGVILLRQLYAREMRALAEGQPLKPWTALEPVATVGA